MRVVQPEGKRGSLKWLQIAVNRRPELLHCPKIGDVEWLSPLADDDYAEYRDGAFLERLRLDHLKNALREFWPARGPQWDALGRSGDRVVLVEAKAHLEEFLTPASGASEVSRQKIALALSSTRTALDANDGTDWAQVFYQYANRIAHLHFLRESRVDAHLLMVGFLNDAEMSGPRTVAEWRTAYRFAEYALGLPKRHAMSRFIHHVYPDVAALEVTA